MTEPALPRMALGLVFVIALILACAWLARRTGLLQRQRSRLLRQVDHLSLGPRGGVAVVEVQDTWLVVGITPGQITLLHTLPAGTAGTADAADAMPSAAPSGKAFPNLLSRILSAGQPRAS